MGILAEKIRDNRFLRLIRNMLKAGYMEDWQYHDTLSGTPQGGVVSPVLSNIYLHKLDEFVERELIPQHTRGDSRKVNREYSRLERTAAGRAAARGPGRGPGTDAADADPPLRRPDGPRLPAAALLRYADDHILGFIGPKAEAEQIKAELAAFLRETLALELNQSKTLITHARTRAARFLGYQITVQHCDTKLTNGCRSVNGKDRAAGPQDVITAKCGPYRRRGKPWHRPPLLNLDDYDIVRIYGAEYRGIVNYYLLAQDVWRLGRAALERRDIHAENPGRQARVHRRHDGGPPQGQGRDRRRAADLLRGPDTARRASRT